MLFRTRRRRGQQHLEQVGVSIGVEIIDQNLVEVVDFLFALQITIHPRGAEKIKPVIGAHAQIMLAGIIEHPRRDIVWQNILIDDLAGLRVGNARAVVADGVIAVFGEVQLIQEHAQSAGRSAGSQRDIMPHGLDFQNRIAGFLRDFLAGVGQRAVDIQHEQFFLHLFMSPALCAHGRMLQRASLRSSPTRQSGR